MNVLSNPATDKVKEGKGKVAAMKVWPESFKCRNKRTGI